MSPSTDKFERANKANLLNLRTRLGLANTWGGQTRVQKALKKVDLALYEGNLRLLWG